MKVKVIQTPGQLKTVDLPEGSNAGDAIREAGFDLSGDYSVKVNGLDATVSTKVTDGSSVIVSKGAKGNN